ncbi:MAG: hypothetical protein BRD45_01165 [Bacteroidetes bacterium QS_8_64_10]|nr:MAG: hypothetical protein BRD45_01165 [Bacteroidetes bacterium QS_8_64_10]
MDDKITFLLNKAQTFLRSAAVLLELEDYDSSASRSYFAMLYAAQAMLVAENGTLPEQRGIRSAFIDQFVDHGPLPERAADAFENAHDLMEVGDYSSSFGVKQPKSERALQEAEAFVNSITDMIQETA